MNDDVFLVFDLDDTLYPERAYAHSALGVAGQELARRFAITDPTSALIRAFDCGERDALGVFLESHGLPLAEKDRLITLMRDHRPDISFRKDAARLIADRRRSGRGYAIVTDGRSITQRRKIEALGCLDALVISISEECGLEKSDEKRWIALENAVGAPDYCYIGDNPAKDFFVPNIRGWETVMLLSSGENIHPQDLPDDIRYHPKSCVRSLDELPAVLSATSHHIDG